MMNSKVWPVAIQVFLMLFHFCRCHKAVVRAADSELQVAEWRRWDTENILP